MKLHKLAAALAFGLCILSALASAEATEDRSIRQFEARVPQAALEDLRQRIAATRWPDEEKVNDRSQGVQLGRIQELPLILTHGWPGSVFELFKTVGPIMQT